MKNKIVLVVAIIFCFLTVNAVSAVDNQTEEVLASDIDEYRIEDIKIRDKNITYSNIVWIK
ncbi:hypothetical protein ALNOE001_07230 [Candidatus Methanobinarius endosymbioticus]|uniref:Uncharacterized protein n=1 Tax=Candidatus Methanobinarius endosymbioticus TaxID=2006182 RepID=A0A366MBP6_9EURY|nr:hypothetical protein ALNOE001_07230 [Candidatus Methanobinarius endosymbioticus]